MITQQEIDRMWLEAELTVDNLFDEVYQQLLGDRAPLLALMQQKEAMQAENQLLSDEQAIEEGV